MQVMLMTLMIISLLILIWFMFSFLEEENQMMNSSFESGFESSQVSFIPFSSQYFMISLIFLVFDLEIVLTLPLPISMEEFKSLMLISFFLIVLAILLVKELKMNSIEWVE